MPMTKAMTAKSTSRFDLITTELARLDAIYAELKPRYRVRIEGRCVDCYASYAPRTRTISFAARFLDGPRAKSDEHVIESVRHEYAHMIVDQFCNEEDEHGDNWRDIAAHIGVKELTQ